VIGNRVGMLFQNLLAHKSNVGVRNNVFRFR
jgi:hypothetical protein